MSDDQPTPLTPEERARLRPALDLAALERLLARLPGSMRAITLLHYYQSPTVDEAVEALEACSADGEDLADLRALATYVPLPPPLAHPENDPDPSWVPPVTTVNISVDPPEDPEMRSLWDAVEHRVS